MTKVRLRGPLPSPVQCLNSAAGEGSGTTQGGHDIEDGREPEPLGPLWSRESVGLNVCVCSWGSEGREYSGRSRLGLRQVGERCCPPGQSPGGKDFRSVGRWPQTCTSC